MLRIGITGHARAGKDTAAKIIQERYGLMHINFADELKADLIKLDPIVDAHGTRLSNALRYFGGDLEVVKGYYPEWRELCQRYGTQVRRAEESEVWVRRLVDKVFETMYNKGGLIPGYVVGDLRFPNEREDIFWNAVIRVTRPGRGPANDHEAESYIDTMEVDYEIANDGTLEEFEQKVLDVMELIDRSRDDEEEYDE
jgi:hypothetical protein